MQDGLALDDGCDSRRLGWRRNERAQCLDLDVVFSLERLPVLNLMKREGGIMCGIMCAGKKESESRRSFTAKEGLCEFEECLAFLVVAKVVCTEVSVGVRLDACVATRLLVAGLLMVVPQGPPPRAIPWSIASQP